MERADKETVSADFAVSLNSYRLVSLCFLFLFCAEESDNKGNRNENG